MLSLPRHVTAKNFAPNAKCPCGTRSVEVKVSRRAVIINVSIPQLERLPSRHESLLPQEGNLLLLARRVRHLVHTHANMASRSVARPKSMSHCGRENLIRYRETILLIET